MEKSINSTTLRFLLLGCLWLFTTSGYAQVQQYLLYFADKDTAQFLVSQPEEYLSQRAIERRQQQNISVDISDFPVNPNYLQEAAAQGGEVIYTSKWFNAALVEASVDIIEQLVSSEYVLSAEIVKPKGRNNRQGGSSSGGASYGKSKKGKKYERAEQLLNQEQNQMLGIDEMHLRGYNGEGVFVAVFDGGFRGVDESAFFEHLYSNDQLKLTYDFVGNSPNVYRYGQHGTEALSCIAAYQPGVLEAGAYAADVMLCITEESGSEYRIEEYNWLFAAEKADSAGVDIISTSLGYTTFDDAEMSYTYSDLDGQTAAITRAARMATAKGILCVVSAGNEGGGRWRYVSPPADAPDILAVGAVGAGGFRASFSSFGPTADGRVKPDVSALGLQTVVVNAQSNITRSNGTSFSAPLISGFAAGVWQAFPQATNLEIMDRIRSAGSQAMTPDNELGYGIPNFEVLADQIPLSTRKPTAVSRYKVFPNPIESGNLFVESADFVGEPLDVYVYNSTGQLLLTQHVPVSNDDSFTVDTSSWQRGVYVLHVLSATASDTVKVIKF
ncbi:S8 family serine peptidase [Tunicatimonas pelagia]|uniref:S8 family serine peptidase n=1 Tax=Tunicatimonas pelagia TaxID=931531 RepID=UPI0026663C6A|nr:S8 family serine peptidase [Tunicatimonas pelagia]WKN44642.1 S8 family serine peptidase [Tunicatimonas pelagia]